MCNECLNEGKEIDGIWIQDQKREMYLRYDM